MGEAESAPVRIAVVGTGNVGATFAYALLRSGLAADIVLINRDAAEAEGEAMDLAHAAPFGRPTRVWAGEYADCASAAVTILTAGAAKTDDGDRLALADQNVEIFGQIVPEVAHHNPDGILLVATNPVDVLTYAAWKLSGFPPARVIGSGTILDTARFRALLGAHLGVNPRDVNAWIVGEHGDSQVPVWSTATVAGVPLAEVAREGGRPHAQTALDDIFSQTRDAAQAVVERKGATYYAVAAGLVRIVEAVLGDEKSVLAVSTLAPKAERGDLGEVCLSLPSVIGRGGVERVLPLGLDADERAALRRSAGVLADAVGRLSLD